MSAPYRAAVVPTRNRHDLLADCINSVVDQVDYVFVIDNGSQPPIDPDPWHGKVGAAVVPILAHFCNHDTRLTPFHFSKLLCQFLRFPKLRFVFCF